MGVSELLNRGPGPTFAMYILKWLVQDSNLAFLASFLLTLRRSRHKVFQEVSAITMDSNQVISEILCLHVFPFVVLDLVSCRCSRSSQCRLETIFYPKKAWPADIPELCPAKWVGFLAVSII